MQNRNQVSKVLTKALTIGLVVFALISVVLAVFPQLKAIVVVIVVALWIWNTTHLFRHAFDAVKAWKELKFWQRVLHLEQCLRR